MFKKGISLTVLTITVTILIILTASVILTSMDFKEKTEYIKFDKNIKMIEKTIRKAYLKGNIQGTLLDDYENNVDDAQDNFNFEPEQIEDLIETLEENYTSVNIENEKEDYYLLNRNDLIELGLNEIYGNYLVNYKKGFVFSINPIQDKEGNLVYTTQFISNIILKTASGQTVTINDIYSKGIYNYRIYGNSVQNGTSTINNPVEIESVGEKSRDILNLYSRTRGTVNGARDTFGQQLEFNRYYIGLTANNYYNPAKVNNVSLEEDTWKINSKESAYGINFPMQVLPETTYKISGIIGENTLIWVGFYDNEGQYLSFYHNNHTEVKNMKFTTPSNAYIATIVFYSETDIETTIKNVQIEEGNVATEYIPYGKYKIPITVTNGSNIETYNIYLDEPLRKLGNYADYIDFKEQKVVRNIKSYTIDNNTTIAKFGGVTNYSAFYLNKSDIKDVNVIANNMTYHNCGGANINSFWSAPYQIGGSIASTYNRIAFTLPNTVEDVAAAKEILRNNPISLYYVTSSPTEERISIPEISIGGGTNIIEVDTEIQPSNIEIEYYAK